MQIRSSEALALTPQMQETLAEIREARGLDVEAFVAAKAAILNDYMRTFGLKACVVAVSGGIDSAVVLSLIAHARTLEGSPIERVVAITLPCHGNTLFTGVTNQKQTVDRAFDLMEALDPDDQEGLVTFPLGPVHVPLVTGLERALAIRPDAWARGQITSTLRTAALSYACTLLTKSGIPAVLVGTTNRDEGGYLGYFGKYSDGAVDLQLISDLHKSEVVALARYLAVPDSILGATPTGDMFDAKTDEEVFGVPYDYVELDHALRCLPDAEAVRLCNRWDDETLAQHARMREAIEAMHRYNRHKYLGRSPAVHLDILDAAVPGGWDNRPSAGGYAKDPSRFVGLYQPGPNGPPPLRPEPNPAMRIREAYKHVAVAGLLREDECESLITGIPDRVWIPVGIDGIRRETPPDVVGSYRASLYDPRLAEAIWQRLKVALPRIRHFDPATAETDCGDHPVWRPVGINPLFRFIRYMQGGKLVPHYDAPYDESATQRTLMSLVIYLEAPADGEGATRFVIDPQEGVPLAQRDLADWTRDATPEEIRACSLAEVGKAIAFDHRVLHDSEAITGRAIKTIVRTDILFERADWYRG